MEYTGYILLGMLEWVRALTGTAVQYPLLTITVAILAIMYVKSKRRHV